MNIIRTGLAAALLLALASTAQALPILLEPAAGGPNLSSSGTTFSYTLDPAALSADPAGPLLLSLTFNVSQNAAAQNDTISLFMGGVLLASGQASSFSVTDLDISSFVDLTTGGLSFQLVRGVAVGGGNIKLASATLTGTPATGTSDSELGSIVQDSTALEVPEPGTLALFGLGMLGFALLGRRGMRRSPRFS